jgi:hypothetical protein
MQNVEKFNFLELFQEYERIFCLSVLSNAGPDMCHLYNNIIEF